MDEQHDAHVRRWWSHRMICWLNWEIYIAGPLRDFMNLKVT